MMQKYYSIDEQDFEWLKRYAKIQERNPSEMVRVIIKERRALCEQERRATGMTSLLKGKKHLRDMDGIENMPIDSMQ